MTTHLLFAQSYENDDVDVKRNKTLLNKPVDSITIAIQSELIIL